MPKTIARDLLRVSAFIPYTSQLVEKIIDRAWWWADDVFVVTPDNRTLDAETYQVDNDITLADSWKMKDIWEEFSNRLELKEGDYVVWLYPSEVLVNSDALRPSIRYNPGKTIGFIRYVMVDEDHFSLYKVPTRVYPVFPFQPGGQYFDYGLDIRGPDYVLRLPKMPVTATELLDYMFFTPEQREFYAERYGEDRLRNIHYMAKEKWTKGGLL